MKTSRILETCLCVDDLVEAEDFYQRVLGLEILTRLEGRHVFFRCGEAMFLLFNAEVTKIEEAGMPAHGTTGEGHAAFAMAEDEIGSWRDHLMAQRVDIEYERTWPGGGVSLYFRDPSGNCLELATPKTWGIES